MESLDVRLIEYQRLLWIAVWLWNPWLLAIHRSGSLNEGGEGCMKANFIDGAWQGRYKFD
jgi:hypothetical protein